MCYDVSSGLRAVIKYAKHRQDDPNKIKELEKQLEVWRIEEHRHFHASGFAHPKLLCFTQEQPDKPISLQWGLIPAWCKDESSALQMMNLGLNARAETMFEKPMFRKSAKSKRCLVYIDGYFEYYHIKSKTFPFYVQMKADMPMALAGLCDEWTNEKTGEVVATVCIVTTKANRMMSIIHNNPKVEESRMPVILKKEDQDLWLNLDYKNESVVKQLLLPFPDEEMRAYPVGKLKGNYASGDTEKAIEEVFYPELEHLKFT